MMMPMRPTECWPLDFEADRMTDRWHCWMADLGNCILDYRGLMANTSLLGR